jgi:hypothetical protein
VVEKLSSARVVSTDLGSCSAPLSRSYALGVENRTVVENLSEPVMPLVGMRSFDSFGYRLTSLSMTIQ